MLRPSPPQSSAALVLSPHVLLRLLIREMTLYIINLHRNVARTGYTAGRRRMRRRAYGKKYRFKVIPACELAVIARGR